jgi:uncharacterized alkaline shock family protein YloU
MNLFNRFIIFIIIMLFMFASLILTIYSFGLSSDSFLSEKINFLYDKWQSGVIFLIAFILGAWVIYPFFTGGNKSTTLIKETGLGEIDITLEALNKLVESISLQQEGIVDINTNLKARDSGIYISLKGKVITGVPIQDISSNLQETVKAYIEDTTGVKVREVKVLVDGINEEKRFRLE